MMNLKENIILYLVFLMIVVSLITPASIYFFAKNSPTASVSTGTVSVIIDDGICGDSICSGNETCSSCEDDCGVCSTPSDNLGSGGGGGSNRETLYDINLDLKNNYLDLKVGNSYVFLITFYNETYNFKVSEFKLNREITFEYNHQRFTLSRDEVGSFDINEDGKTDFTIDFDGQFVDIKISLIPQEIGNVDGEVGFNKEKIVRPLGLDSLQLNYGVLSIFVAIVFVVLLLMVYQSFKLKKLEKTNPKVVEKIYYKYKKTNKSSKDKALALSKLNRQKDLLDKAKNMKLISESSYKVSMEKIDRLKKKI